MIRPVLAYPHPLLSTESWKVPDFGGDRAKAMLASLAQDMHDTVQVAGGKSISGIQLGARWQAIYVCKELAGEPLVMFNPQLLGHGELLQHMREGCLSVPTIDIDVQRFASVRVWGQHVDGSAFEVDAVGVFAQALQHELAHLRGHTIIECCAPPKRSFLRKRLQRQFGGADGKMIDYATSKGSETPDGG